MEWKILTPEEQAAYDAAHAPSPEMQAELDRRDAWDEKHPRCWVCGQFVGGVSHFYQDYWGEWDHV